MPVPQVLLLKGQHYISLYDIIHNAKTRGVCFC